jgi:uncharacterized phage protein (TIGR01671 family)
MRSIKFRAWDGKEFLPLAREVAFIDDNGNLRSRIEGVVFSQFTGLLDKHGNEVYEGDIVEIEDATAKVVFWERPPEFGLDYYHNEGKWCEDWNLSYDNNRMEVIGNIWENPDLVG